jgi:Major Facilitator Superfamily
VRGPETRLAAYAVAASLLRLANEGARVVLALLALERDGRAAAGGLLVAALLAPHVIAAPLVGALADRSRHPDRLIAMAALGFAGSLAGTAAAFSRAPLWVVLVLLLAGGCCGSTLTGVLSSRLPAVVEPSRLPRAFGVDSLTYNLAGILGPAVAAVVAGRASAAVGTYALAGSAAVGASLLPVLASGRPANADQESGVPTSQARPDPLAGIRILGRDRVLGTVTAATSVGQLGGGALPVIAAVLAQRQYGAAWAGWLLSAGAAAALLGSLAWTWRPAPAARAPVVVLAGLVGVGLPLAAAAGASSAFAVAALFALSGLFQGPLFGALLTTRERQAPRPLHAQVFAVGAGAKMTASAAGAALGGALAGAPTAVQLLLAGAWPAVAGGVGFAVLRPRLRSAARPPHGSPRAPAPDAG